MKVHLTNVYPGSVLGGVVAPDENVRALFEGVKREEFATIYFALRSYEDKLTEQLDTFKNIQPSKEHTQIFEERMFLHQSLANVTGVLFEMIENFPELERENMRKWSEVV